MNSNTTLVLGATGKTGSRIVERLRSRGVPVRIGSRSAQPSFDWETQATWPAALQGVESVYISYFPDLAAAGATDAIRALARAPRDFADYARKTAASGVWNTGAV